MKKKMESFLRKTKLTEETIEKFKLVEDENRVEFPYFDVEKNMLFSKIYSKDGSIREYPDDKPKMLYNGWNIGKYKKYTVVCSDEIDCLTLLQLGIKAVACPEPGTFYLKWAKLFEGIQDIFVFLQNSKEAESCREKIAESFLGKTVYEVKIPKTEGIKGVNDLYVKEGFEADDFKQLIWKTKEDYAVLESQEEDDNQNTIRTSGFVLDEAIGELVRNSSGQKCHFLVYDSRTGKLSKIEKFEYRGKKYLPLKIHKLLLDKVVRIPSEAEDYVDTQHLIAEIRKHINNYADIPDALDKEIVIAYILLSWVYDRFSSLPYVRFMGDYGTGKSRMLKILCICYKSIYGGNMTEASIFRIIDQFSGTLIIDEAELEGKNERHKAIKEILRLGKDTDGVVMRCDGDDLQPRSFKVFCPKVLGSRRSYDDDALESRIWNISMKETKKEDIPLQLDKAKFDEECSKLRSMLLKWRLENFFSIDTKAYKEYVSKDISKRLNEMIAPLICVRKDDKEFIEMLIGKARDKQTQLIEDRYMSLEAHILKLVYYSLDDKVSRYVMLKDISYDLWSDYHINVLPRTVGRIARDLGMRTKHTRESTGIVKDREKVEGIIREKGLQDILKEDTGNEVLEKFKKKMKEKRNKLNKKKKK